jgi:hypothetical protein
MWSALLLTQIAAVTSFRSPTFATSHTRWTLSEIWALSEKGTDFFQKRAGGTPVKKWLFAVSGG